MLYALPGLFAYCNVQATRAAFDILQEDMRLLCVASATKPVPRLMTAYRY